MNARRDLSDLSAQDLVFDHKESAPKPIGISDHSINAALLDGIIDLLGSLDVRGQGLFNKEAVPPFHCGQRGFDVVVFVG
jgi:hypothetical protein